MTVGVDCGALSITDHRLRVGVYWITRNFIRQLGVFGKSHQFLLYGFAPFESEVLAEMPDNCKPVIIRPSKAWSRIWLPFYLRMRSPDIFLGLSQAVVRYPGKSVGIIYDLGFFNYPDLYHDNEVRLQRQTEHLINLSTAVVTVSKTVAKETIERFKLNPNMVHTAHLGVDKIFTVSGKLYRNEKPYYLYVGALKKPKNIPLLLKAFSLLQNKTNFSHDLLLAGGDYWSTPEVTDSIRRLSLETSVKFLGHLPQSQLPPLYRSALAFVSPSKVEGFCMPAVEAMACGCPVIVSDIPVFREIAGNAGLYARSDNAIELSNTMLRVSHGIGRNQYWQRGIEQAKKYSWSKFAKKVIKIMQNLS